jgi:Flp pilus assembly protein TadD
MPQRHNHERTPAGRNTVVAPSRRWTLLAAAVLLGAGIATYWNSFAGQFVFDDLPTIPGNPSITDLRDLGQVLRPPRNSSTAGRPLVNLTLALNYAIGDATDPWSYHAFNLAVHLLAALVLMGVVRRTLLSPPLRDRFGRAALPLAAAVALLWMLHPLQVQAVTYITQRAESMVSLFYLLTLYCTIRSASSATAQRVWTIGAILACAAGMVSKEVMVTAPVTVLVYDRLFLAGGWKQALARRRVLYIGLAATWLILAGLMWQGPRSATTGFGLKRVTPFQYATTEFGVILYYLRLAFWPSPLVADYEWPWAQSLTQVLPAALAVGALVAATGWLLWRGRPVAMAGVWFFLILSPTSSFVPTLYPIFEYRVYLALAALIAVVVVGSYRLLSALGRGGQPTGKKPIAVAVFGTLVITALAAPLGWLTHQRNKVYTSTVSFWQDVVDKQPKSRRGHYGLGFSFLTEGEIDQGIEHLQTAKQLSGDHPHHSILNNLAWALFHKGRYSEAEQEVALMLSTVPTDADSLTLKGFLAMKRGKVAEAADAYARALQTDPNYIKAIGGQAIAYLALGKTSEAKAVLARAKGSPDDPEIAMALADLHVQLGDVDIAITILREVLKQRQTAQYVPAMAMLGALYNKVGDFPKAVEILTQAAALATIATDKDISNRELGLAYSQMRQFPQAEQAYLAALKADGNDSSALNNLAYLYANNLNRPDQALPYASQAAQLQPNDPDILYTYGWVLAKTSAYVPAESQLIRALQLYKSPYSVARVHCDLGWICEQTHRPQEAARHYRQGLQALQGRQDEPVYKNLSKALDRVQESLTPNR